ncbi:MAG: YggS family pyridoxal phosphate-dependent enzyme [Mariprofundaceae bacterium]|nr:YggS family pyridoxal phosphate-dependent enzyme [Mariprofundaceae bacterium]
MSDSKLIQRWKNMVQSLPEQTQLLAVSKYTTDEKVACLIKAGQQDFAEAKPQSLRDRAQHYPQVRWHMIGPLQKNKAKYVGKFAATWHSLCDVETALAVAKHVQDRVLPVWIQVNISGESQKQGVSEADLTLFYTQICPIKELHVVGLMGMAAKDGDKRQTFAKLRQCRDNLLAQFPESACQGLSMGMSNDWRIAIEEGATMIRLGSNIFND